MHRVLTTPSTGSGTAREALLQPHEGMPEQGILFRLFFHGPAGMQNRGMIPVEGDTDLRERLVG